MPLTLRSNGSGSSNIISASWFNDFYNLLTGVMQDQEVSIKNNLVLQAIGAAPTAALAAALTAGTAMGIGLYDYVYTYVSPDGESTISPVTAITTTSGNQKVNLSGITVGPTGTTARNIYRTVVGGGTAYKLLHQIADNTTTTYIDATADASLGAAAPTAPTFGGSLVIKDSTGTVKFRINNDGSFSAGGTTGMGSTQINGTLTVTGTSSLDNGAITTDGAGTLTTTGAVTLANAKSYQIKNATGTVKGVLGIDVSNNVNVYAADANIIYFRDNGGAQMAHVNTVEFGLNHALKLAGGATLTNFSTFGGTGSGTYNHNNGAAPAYIAPIVNVAGSATQGYDTVTSTQCHVTLGASLGFNAFAWR